MAGTYSSPPISKDKARRLGIRKSHRRMYFASFVLVGFIFVIGSSYGFMSATHNSNNLSPSASGPSTHITQIPNPTSGTAHTSSLTTQTTTYATTKQTTTASSTTTSQTTTSSALTTTTSSSQITSTTTAISAQTSTTTSTSTTSTTSTTSAVTPPSSVSVSLTCSPNSITPLTSTSCGVTVTDSGSAPPTVPTGTVVFSSNAGGTFSATQCDLSSGSCAVAYTSPSASAPFLVSISATYQGDALHSAGVGTANVLVSPRSVSVSVACQPNTVKSQASTLCTVTVTDTGPGTQVIPTGALSFASDSGGTFSPTQCALASGSCSVTFTAPVVSAQTRVTITAFYFGDAVHSGGSGQTVIHVN